MGDEGSQALGAPEIAGTFVNPRGMAKKMTASVAGGQLGGAVGSFAASTLANRTSKATAAPAFGRVGYVAVSLEEVALIKTKSGAFKMKVTDEVLARAPRGEVASADLDEGRLLSHLKIAFDNGVTWEFDIPRQARSTAQDVVRALRM